MLNKVLDKKTLKCAKKFEKFVKKICGITSITSLKDVKDVSIIFDEIEKTNYIEQAEYLDYIFDFYYNLSCRTTFNNEVESGLSRMTFSDAREILWSEYKPK